MEAKKKSHTSSEMSIIKSYLFRDRLIYHSPLSNGEKEPNPADGREWERVLCIGIYSIRGFAQMGRLLKNYWL